MARQNERLFMSRDDWDEWDSKQWARFDRMYYGEPWYGQFTGPVGHCKEEVDLNVGRAVPAEKMVDTVHPTQEETIWD